MLRYSWRGKRIEHCFFLFSFFLAYALVIRLPFFDNFNLLSIDESNSLSLRKGVSYSNNWVLDPYGAYAFFMHKQQKKCPLCFFRPSDWKGDSTKNDAIVTFCFGQHTSITPFVRMLRTVQCNAKLFILADSVAYEMLKRYIFTSYFQDCDVVAIDCGKFIGNITNRWPLYQMKTFVYRDFLHSYYHLFDRVFMCDMADSVFQSDPFKDFMHEDAAFNYVENISIYDEMETYDDIYEKLKSNISDDSFIITPAAYFGKPSEVLKLLDLVESYFFNDDGRNTELVDQSVVTTIYYKKIYELYNIHMKAVDWNMGILSANLNEFSSFSLGNISCIGCDKQPFLIHHSNYIYEIIESTYINCPRLRHQKPHKYLSNLPEETRKRIDRENAEKIRAEKRIIRLAKEARKRGEWY